MRGVIFSLLAIAAGVWSTACSDHDLHAQPQPDYPAIEVEPASIDFGLMETGSFLLQEVTVRSTGEIDLDLTDMMIDGPDNFEFGFDWDFGTESFVLTPGEETTVRVYFTALGDGDDEATLQIYNTDPEDPVAEVELHGAGLAPAIFIDPPVWGFGGHDVGCEVTTDVWVRSVGTYPLTINDYSFVSSPSFTAITAYSDEVYPGLVLAPGEEALVRLTFIPEDIVTYEGILSVSSDDPEDANAEATQTGIGTAGAWFHDHFVQEGNNWTDILWVIDNSCSMEDEQGKLGDDFVYFHSIVNTAGVDYRIATVTTDSATFNCPGCPHGYIDHSTQNGAQVFENNCAVGTNGSGTERGLKFGYDALVNAINQVPPNDYYWRDDAGLRVVFVSDEPDQSGSWSSYLSNYQGMKMNPDHVILSAICGTDGATAQNCSGGGGSASAGTGYVDAVNSTGGILASICESDWSASLTNLGWLSISLADTFPLSEQPVIASTITVQVNGVEVTNGWYYDAAMQAVVFEPDYVPGDGDTIDVDYGIPGNCDG